MDLDDRTYKASFVLAHFAGAILLNLAATAILSRLFVQAAIASRLAGFNSDERFQRLGDHAGAIA